MESLEKRAKEFTKQSVGIFGAVFDFSIEFFEEHALEENIRITRKFLKHEFSFTLVSLKKFPKESSKEFPIKISREICEETSEMSQGKI